MNLAPYDPDRLWIKARLFINRAMEEERDFGERAFWAATSFELLGKAALARVSPLLIAMPTDDAQSIVVATGRTEETTFFTVAAKAVWSRCDRLFKPFHKGEAALISNARNEYLHAGGIGFDADPASWWPRFWAQAVILLHHLEEDPASFVGDERADEVRAHLDTNRANVARRLEALLERARARIAQRRDGTATVAEDRAWAKFAPLPSYFVTDATCPACGAEGSLRGNDALDKEYRDYYGDPDDVPEYDVVITTRAEEFICMECHLQIDDYKLLEAAGFADTFESTHDASEYPPDEPEYFNE